MTFFAKETIDDDVGMWNCFNNDGGVCLVTDIWVWLDEVNTYFEGV